MEAACIRTTGDPCLRSLDGLICTEIDCASTFVKYNVMWDYSMNLWMIYPDAPSRSPHFSSDSPALNGFDSNLNAGGNFFRKLRTRRRKKHDFEKNTIPPKAGENFQNSKIPLKAGGGILKN